MPIHGSYVDLDGFVHETVKDGETGELISDDVKSEPDPDDARDEMLIEDKEGKQDD